ncbi:MAG: hypothetical protein PVJ42_01770 [bacterium]
MMKRHLLPALIAALCLLVMTCAVIPRSMSRERDIEGRSADFGAAAKTLLVASRTSEFKDAVIDGIEHSFEAESIAMRFIGLQDLRYESAEDYDAVVLMNTCIAWSLDTQVDAFLNKYRDTGNIVVVTTSGDGHWEPKKQNRRFDTVASASEMARVSDVVDEITAKVRPLLGS